MTFVGKVLVVVNVVLTVCIAMFAAGVYSVQTSWRDSYQKEKDLREKNKVANDQQVAGLQKELTQANKDLKEFQGRTANAEAQVAALRQAAVTTAQTHAKEKQSYERQVALQKVIVDDNAIKLQELQVVRDALAQLRVKLKSLTQQVAQLEDDKYGLQRKEMQVARKYNEMLETLVAYRKFLQMNKLTFDAAAVAGLDVLPDPAEGIVTDVSPGTRDKATLVEISVGSDDGVRKGTVMHVFRLNGKGKYLGKIRITEQPLADKAYGEVIDDAKQGPIRKGDQVAAKLKY